MSRPSCTVTGCRRLPSCSRSRRTGIISDYERSRAVIQELHDLGLVISIDDFGAGFTSLVYLRDPPSASSSWTACSSPAGLASRHWTGTAASSARRSSSVMRLGLVVAEGVEDLATLDKLGQLGCDLAQGYFVARPAPAAQVVLDPTSPCGPRRCSAPLVLRCLGAPTAAVLGGRYRCGLGGRYRSGARRLLSMRCFPPLGLEPLQQPARATFPRVTEPVVQPVVSVLPELEHIRQEAIAAPPCGPRHLAVAGAAAPPPWPPWKAVSSATRSSSTSRLATGSLWWDAQAPMRAPNGLLAKYRSDSSAATRETDPSMRT